MDDTDILWFIPALFASSDQNCWANLTLFWAIYFLRFAISISRLVLPLHLFLKYVPSGTWISSAMEIVGRHFLSAAEIHLLKQWIQVSPMISPMISMISHLFSDVDVGQHLKMVRKPRKKPATMTG